MGGEGWSHLHVVKGRVGRGGPGRGEVCLVWSRAEVTSHLHALTLVPVTSVPFSLKFSSCQVLFWSPQWPCPQERHAPCKRPMLAMPLAISSPENELTVVENKSLVGPWDN